MVVVVVEVMTTMMMMMVVVMMVITTTTTTTMMMMMKAINILCNGLTVKTELQACSTQECPVDGGWSDWDDWQDYDECSALCGGGTKDQWRMRRCDNPAPAFGGSDCQGPERQNGTVNCNTDSCGDRCPDGANTYIANTNNADRYYQCVHGVARLMDCADGTVWDQTTSTCVLDLSEPDCADGTVWDEATQMCVHDTSNPDCADGTVWDEAAQMCVHDTSNPDCADGTVWDEATEMCVHDTSNPDCADGTVWDEATASCVHDSPQGCDSSVPIQPHQDCTKYVICSHGNAIVMPCSPGMRYNDVIKVCDWADNVSCDN
nr:hypothetical protein BaRGS_013189 [Batillaria attramentaria]